MTNLDQRLLDPTELPTSLWQQASETLILPTAIANAYITLLETSGLIELANTRDLEDPPVGGLTQEATNKHLAQAFDGSAARALLAILDPKNEVGPTSNTFIRCTAGNKISLTDAPCGAGAAGLTFLTALAELRSSGVLPRIPLHVSLIAAELSNPARIYAKALFDQIRPSLEEQAIFVNEQFLYWDVTDEISTANLVTSCLAASTGVTSRLLVVANFNGFLEKERKRKESQTQLNELFRYASGANSFAIWIEPNMKRATGLGGLFSWLNKLFSSSWKAFGRTQHVSGPDHPMFVSEARFQLPLAPTKSARVGLAVMPINLTRMK